MPRGVYDRSKTKTQRSAEKSASHSTTSAPKGRPGRKPGSKNKTATSTETIVSQNTQARQGGGGYEAFGEIRQNLMTLNMLAPHFASDALKSEVAANIEVLGDLREQFFPKQQSVQNQAISTEQVASQNGVTQEYRPTVPLPPPVQVIPPHS